MKRHNSIPFVSLLVELHGCVALDVGEVDRLREKLKEWLNGQLLPDFDSDIEVTLFETAGQHEPVQTDTINVTIDRETAREIVEAQCVCDREGFPGLPALAAKMRAAFPELKDITFRDICG